LQISSYWQNGSPITVDFLPTRTGDWLLANKRNKPKVSFQALLSSALPDRLAETLAEKLGLAGHVGDIADKALAAAETHLHNWSFTPNGTEGFAKAEVTVGGVSTDELSSKTMESKKVAGLYFIGECVDVTGWLGGYNFQWAWASGVAAGDVA
jgi:predicted Rossmann fold flavoprotein